MTNANHVKNLSSRLSNMKFMMRGAPLSPSAQRGGDDKASNTVVKEVSVPVPSAAAVDSSSSSNADASGSSSKPAQAKLVIEMDSSYLPFIQSSSSSGRMSYGGTKERETNAEESTGRNNDATVSDADMARTLAAAKEGGLPSNFGSKRRREAADDGDSERPSTSSPLQAKDGGVKKAKKAAPWANKSGGGGGKRFFSKPLD